MTPTEREEIVDFRRYGYRFSKTAPQTKAETISRISMVHVLRILTKNCKSFGEFSHMIPHQYSKEMSQCSQIVSLNLISLPFLQPLTDLCYQFF